MLDLSFQTGAVIYVKDKASGEVLTDTNPEANFPRNNVYGTNAKDPRGFVGFYSTPLNDTGTQAWRLPQDAQATYTAVDQNHVKVAYSPLYYCCYPNYGLVPGTSLTYNFSVDESTGEVILGVTGQEVVTNWGPRYLNVPVMNFKKNSVIIRSAKYERNDLSATDSANNGGTSIYSPAIAVAEGDNSVLSVWSQDDKYIAATVKLIHKPEYDHIVMETSRNSQQSNQQAMSSSEWRIGTYQDWVKAAKRWKEKFEELNPDVEPLWNNRAEWVRDIHAVYNFCNFCNESLLNNLASIIPPKNLLYYIQGGTHVIHGDHTQYSGNCNTDCACTENKGFHVITYYYWNLIHSQTGYVNQLAHLADIGSLPANYKFTPDYVGADDPGFAGKSGDERNTDWLTYWSDVDVNYYSGNTLRIIHPGATKFQDYLLRNYADHISTRHASGSFFDISGAEHQSMFPANKKIIEGLDYLQGEVKTLKRVTTELPNNPIMSENLHDHVIPYVFYTWEGYDTHVKMRNFKVNHPLRTALIGSYVWAQEQNVNHGTPYNFDDVPNTLLGTLPHMVTEHGYWNVDATAAAWSQARAKLFSEDELWNDLPDNWDPEALAYYRTKYGTWMKAKKIGSDNFGYYEEIPGMGDILRLQKSNPVILPRALRGDLNEDNKVDLTDFNILKTDILRLTGSLANPRSDINGDGQATIRDVGIMMSGWR